MGKYIKKKNVWFFVFDNISDVVKDKETLKLLKKHKEKIVPHEVLWNY